MSPASKRWKRDSLGLFQVLIFDKILYRAFELVQVVVNKTDFTAIQCFIVDFAALLQTLPVQERTNTDLLFIFAHHSQHLLFSIYFSRSP
ncbi:MAG: hypothetical protein Q7U74_05040, partial [Saprospiraceae bacterium]|nr:hypothetical protein [Saprospiraceae bacterium]